MKVNYPVFHRLYLQATHAIGWVLLALVYLLTCRVSVVDATHFNDVAESAGLTHKMDFGPPEVAEHYTTAGAAAGDVDNDGWVDLYVTRVNATDILYCNNGDGTFTDVTDTAFGDVMSKLDTSGAAFGDIDNDGDLDLYVTAVAEPRHYLYINDGMGRFTEEAVERNAGIGSGEVTGTSVSFGDYDNDGFLDIYVTDWQIAFQVPARSRLLHNLGAAMPGYFEDTTVAAGVALDLIEHRQAKKSLGYTPRFVDLDRDGLQDIAVASDLFTSRIFWNNGDGTFEDGTNAAGIFTGSNDMGFTVGDVDGDGDLDWFVTSIGYDTGQHPSGNRLFINNGDRTFTDGTQAAHVREGGWGWAADMLDYDNDGDLDIAMTNGFVSEPWDMQQVHFFANDGTGIFSDVSDSVGFTNVSQGRGLLTFDYDKDGDLDVYIANFQDAPVLYENVGGNDSAYLRIRTVGVISNRNGIGTFITVTPDVNDPNHILVTEIDGSSNYLAQSETIAHFGLGPDADSIDKVTIEWIASGITQEFFNIEPNSLLTTVELTPLPGDANNDGVVDVNDYTAVQANLGHTGYNDGLLLGDANDDGRVDPDDLTAVAENLGAVSPDWQRDDAPVADPNST